MRSVSHSFMSVQLGLVPRSPIDPVTYGTSSSSAARPSRAFATPAPSLSAICITCSWAPSAPRPTRFATFSPASRISAARFRSASCGTTRGALQPGDEWIVPCLNGGSGTGRLLAEVVRDDDAGHLALVERDPVRAVDEVADLRGVGRHLAV